MICRLVSVCLLICLSELAMEDDDFFEKLIEAVQVHRCLYDKSDRSYFNKLAKDEIWASVANTTGKTPHECKARWKLLRERFAKELRKVGVEGSSRWFYFNSMMFLKKYVQAKGNRSIYHDDDDDDDDDGDEEDEDRRSNCSTESLLKPSAMDPLEMTTNPPSSSPPPPPTTSASTDPGHKRQYIEVHKYDGPAKKPRHAPPNDASTSSRNGVRATLLAMGDLLNDVPDDMVDEFLKQTYCKVMDVRAAARKRAESGTLVIRKVLK